LKSDLKFKTENRIKRKENRTKKIEEAYLAVARLAGPTSQPIEAQPRYRFGISPTGGAH
jgi:hypothetical protein